MQALPEGCVAAVISFTTPRDACRLACVSTIFRSASDADVVWDRFLHPISLPGSVSNLSKKELYLRTGHNLIHNGKLSFWFDLPSGKKCYMISPRELNIVDYDPPLLWQWHSIPVAQHYFGIPDGRYNKREEDFTSHREYTDCLEEVEDMIFNLNEGEMMCTIMLSKTRK